MNTHKHTDPERVSERERETERKVGAHRHRRQLQRAIQPRYLQAVICRQITVFKEITYNLSPLKTWTTHKITAQC